MSRFILLLVLALANVAYSSWVNEQVTRNIGCTHNNGIKEILQVRASRVKDAQSYQFHLAPEEYAGRLARLSCEIDSQAVQEVTTTKESEKIIVAVAVPSEFKSGTISCTSIRVGENARAPLPAEIAQLDRQRFVFHGAAYRVASPYKLQGDESTMIVFPGGKVDQLAELPYTSVSGNKVTLGPYQDQPPSDVFSDKNRLSLQYDANFAFPVATTVTREIELSHWGNIAVEEYFDVRNGGAKLKNGFSRLDHQMRDPRHSFQALDAYLPAEAYGVYYRDELGNVTSSNLRKSKTGKSTLLQMKLRFPIYGGWHINWYQGYNVPLTSFVTQMNNAPDRYLLECDVFHPISIVADTLIVHVVLPAGATNWKIESPAADKIISQTTFSRNTYLDVPWSQRTVIRLELRDVFGGDVTESGVLPRNVKEDRIRIYYSYSQSHVPEKPLTVAASIFSMLVAYMLASRVSQ